MKSKLILKAKSDEPVVINGRAGFFNENLWLTITDMTLTEVLALVMRGPDEMFQDIEFDYGVMKDVFAGFTHVRGIIPYSDRIEIRLAGGTVQKEVEVANVEGMEDTDGADEASSSDGSESGSVPT